MIKKVSILDTYQSYIKRFKKHKVHREVYRKINRDYVDFMKNLIMEGEKVCLPARMGIIFIEGNRPEIRDEKGEIALPVDWGRTLSLWKKSPEAKEKKTKVYFTNEHTDGYVFGFRWHKVKSVSRKDFLKGYSFEPYRSLKTELNQKLVEGKEYRRV